MTPPLNTRNLIILLGLCFGSIFYGFYLITLALYLNAMFASRSRRKLSLWARSGGVMQPFSFWLLMTVLILAAVTTTEEVNTVASSIYYLAIYIEGDTKNPQSVHTWATMISLGNCLVATGLTDGILILRCYIIYGRSWRIVVLPMLTSASAVVCYLTTLPLTVTWLGDLDTPEVTPRLKALGFAAYLSVITTHVITTGLIVYRIRQAKTPKSQASSEATDSSATPRTSQEHPGHGTDLARLARVIGESGLLTTAFLLMMGITYLVDWRYVNCISTATIQVVGIAFNLISYRVNKERNRLNYQDSPQPDIVPEVVVGDLSTMQFRGHAPGATMEVRSITNQGRRSQELPPIRPHSGLRLSV